MGSCYNSTTVPASIDKVWSTIRDFHEMAWANSVVEKLEVVGYLRGNQIGAKRILNDAIHETLLGLNDLNHTIVYQITDGPGPIAKDAVQKYIGTVELFPVTTDGTTFVKWTSRYDSPNDSAVEEMCNPIYQGLLQDLRKHFE